MGTMKSRPESDSFLELFGFGNIETDEICSVLYELYHPNSYYCIHMPSHIWNSNVCFNQPVVSTFVTTLLIPESSFLHYKHFLLYNRLHIVLHLSLLRSYM